MEPTTTATVPERLLTDQEATEFRRSRRAFRAGRALILLGLAGIVAAVVWPASAHMHAAFWLRTIGAQIEWTGDHETWGGGGVTSASLSEARLIVRDSDLKLLKNLRNVEALDLAQCDSITDKGLAVLRDLTALRELDLSRNRLLVSDEDVQPKLSDAVLTHVAALPKLKHLTLVGNRITDSGLARLASLAELEYLDLRETLVTDRGLEPLKGLKRLKTLRVAGTRVTPAGAMAFRQVLPEAEVVIKSDTDMEYGPGGVPNGP